MKTDGDGAVCGNAAEKNVPGKKKRRLKRILILILGLIVLVPAAFVGFSFIGRIRPESVIPDSFRLYAYVPDPVKLLHNLLEHEALPEIISHPALAPLAPVIADFKGSGIADNFLLGFAGRGEAAAALLESGHFLAAWDMRVMSSVFRILPHLAGQITIPNLYYVQAGKNSRFEYRLKDGRVFFIGLHKNLLIISDDSPLFESVLAGTSRDGDIVGASRKVFSAQAFDAAFLLSPDFIMETLSPKGNAGTGAEADNPVAGILKQVRFSGFPEAALSFLPDQIDLKLTAPLSAADGALERLLSRDSRVASFPNLLPGSAQYSVILSAGSIPELLSAASPVSGPAVSANLQRADSAARMFFGMGLDEMVFSWAGSEIAAFGLEGRPFPVFAIQVEDENRRREVFNRVFSSLIISENISTVLDGTRIPQIRLPGFLDSLLRLWDVVIPSPFYYVQDGFLFVSESPESLITALSAIRANNILPKSELWRKLSRGRSGGTSLCLFYSLDRALPFFLKGNTAISSVLRLYRQGLADVRIENSILTFSLSAVPGSGRGLQLFPGFPLEVGGKTGNAVYAALTEKKEESRILFTRGDSAIAADPVNNTLYEYGEFKNPGEIWCVPAWGLRARDANDALAWVVTRRGQAALVNGAMKPVKGFPLVTGCSLSAVPSAFDGKLFLTDEDGSLSVLDQAGNISRISFDFDGSVLRSPPSFLEAGGKKYMAMYPKSFMGELWLSDTAGNVCPGWPVQVSGIAFGSPLLFSHNGKVFAAFVTQAGELSVFTEEGMPAPGFPLNLNGVFHIQPVWDGASLWLLSSAGVLHQAAFDSAGAETGARVLSQTVPGLRAEEGVIFVSDPDGDGTPEIFFTGEANALYGYSRSFSLLAGFPLPVWGLPAFADFNGDGRMECAGAGLDNLLYRWQFR
ncbi:MAG: VCBS repeat-containing protein [Spirochaetales bacterium]|jgi:hypothetical protein|nr:VCBS repeat-containing protein [Spirochaetales bacterium]